MLRFNLWRLQRPVLKRIISMSWMAMASDTEHGTVVLTREKDSNAKTKKVLQVKGLETIEVPLINFLDGPDTERLTETLREKEYEWITLTSPQAARVFLSAWQNAGCPFVRIATFEEGSIEVIDNFINDDSEKKKSIKVEFTPRISNAATLARTLPLLKKGNHQVLYPTSSKASNTLEEALRVRQFEVTRLNTYNTENITEISDEEIQLVLSGDVLTFASPSTLDAWTKIAGSKVDYMQNIACIGATTANRAQLLGYKNVYFPVKPGFEGFIDTITKILEEMGKPVYGEDIQVSERVGGVWQKKRRK